MAQPFDARRLVLSGSAIPIVDSFVGQGVPVGPFSLSTTGTLAYRIGGQQTPQMQFAWFDRQGKPLQSVGTPGEYGQPDLSPDGRFVVFQRGNEPDIWVLDAQRGGTNRITSHPDRDTSPVWSPDGKSIAFDSNRNGARNLYSRAFGMVGEDTVLLKTNASRNVSDWSRDGKYLAYEGGTDIWAVDLTAASQSPLQLTQTPFVETNPRISPDGHWVAFESTESEGQGGIYVQSFPKPGVRLPVSTHGGVQPMWSHDGRELYYLAPDFSLMAVSVKSQTDSVELSAPVVLFKPPLSRNTRRNYWPARDGRFLFSLPAEEPALTPIIVMLNWASAFMQ